MRVPGVLPAASALVAVVLVACSSDPEEPTPDGGPKLSQVVDDYRDPPRSCALACSEIEGCEPNGYECPALAPWKDLPHAESCGAWDGTTFPTPQQGKCKATLPTGEAQKRTGVDPDDPRVTILPTGYRAKPAGRTHGFTDSSGGFPVHVVPVPGTDLAIVIDSGIGDQAVRLVDTKRVGFTSGTVLGILNVGRSETINYGAVVVDGTKPTEKRVWASGGASSKLYAFDVDLSTAPPKLVRRADADVAIDPAANGWPKGGGREGKYMIGGIAARKDGTLVVATQNSPGSLSYLLVVDPAKKAVIGKPIEILGKEIFTVAVHPDDPESRYAWVSSWDGDRIDVVDLVAQTVKKSIAVGKAPQAFAPIGTRYVAVVSSDADVITVFDTLPDGWSKVLEVPVAAGVAKYGWSASGAAYDDARKRLYVSLAGLNAVAAFEVSLPASGPPTLAPLGMLPSEWWPTAVAIRPTDGALLVVTGKGRGTGANPIPFKPSEGDITRRMKGSIQVVEAPDAAALTAGKTAVDLATDLSKLPGAPKVECGGAPYDFPIPATNTEGPSKAIEHVVFIIKENKTFDAVFGDMPGVEGDPKLIMAPGRMEALFGNERKLAKTFTNFDNYYTSAEQSIQGHVWTAYGRTTEFIERTWLIAWGRGIRLPVQGVSMGKPVEGSLFNWFQREGVLFDNMGELAGAADDDKKTPRNCCYDGDYPGLVYAQEEPDTRKACYITGRARVLCNLRPFTYALMPNDHTSGGSGGLPTVESYIAVGDEGVGLLVAGLSRAPIWPKTLVIVTMDDPQDGGDHVDAHRTPLFMAGPWVKRGYVSKGHYDTSSLHKLFAHIYGKPYPNEIVARASLPLDAFTSTPDFTPFDHIPRTQPLACNPKTGKAATTAAMSNWDLSQPDQAPGIGRQVWELLHDGAPPPPGTYEDDDDDD